MIKGGLALGCAGACGVYWLAVGMFRLRGAGARGALWGARAIAVATFGAMLWAIGDSGAIAWDELGKAALGCGAGYGATAAVSFILFINGFENDAKRKGVSFRVASTIYFILELGVLASWIMILWMAMPAGALRFALGLGAVMIMATFYLAMIAEWCKADEKRLQCGRRW